MWQRNVPISYFNKNNIVDEDKQKTSCINKFPYKVWRMATKKEAGFAWGYGGILLINRAELEHYLSRPDSEFRTRDFCSIIRQLNIYGFKKLPPLSLKISDCFSHPLFNPKSPRLLRLMKRNPSPSYSSVKNSVWPSHKNIGGKVPSERLVAARNNLRAVIEDAYDETLDVENDRNECFQLQDAKLYSFKCEAVSALPEMNDSLLDDTPMAFEESNFVNDESTPSYGYSADEIQEAYALEKNYMSEIEMHTGEFVTEDRSEDSVDILEKIIFSESDFNPEYKYLDLEWSHID